MLTIQEQLHTSRSRLLSAIEGLSDDQLNWKPDESTWSISQIVQHVAKVESGSSQLIQLGLSQEPTFVPIDIPFAQLLSDRSRKVNAPDYLHPSAEPKTIEQFKETLHSSREKLFAALDSIENAALLDSTSPPMAHPVFGHLSTGQWISLVPLHEERHIQQIEEVKERYQSR
jgi:uncharacterized damage-inducible protein DinB